MKILLLGGISEAVGLAEQLSLQAAEVTYSTLSSSRQPDATCSVHIGGFGGAAGLSRFLKRGGYELLLDVTHPYAATISAHGVEAALDAGIQLWRYYRPPWRQGEGDDWQTVTDWLGAAFLLKGYVNPLITIGRAPLINPVVVPAGAAWMVRCLPGWEGRTPPGIELIEERGPFDLMRERQLFDDKKIDLLVSKNSGGPHVAAKIQVARERRIPVLMLKRPDLPAADRLFNDTDDLLLAAGDVAGRL